MAHDCRCWTVLQKRVYNKRNEAEEEMTGMKDQMKEIAVVIFDYGTSTDHGSEIFHIFTEQYVKP